MDDLLTLDNAVALLTLTSLEIVLGIDNVVFIAILCDKVSPEQQGKARRTGLALAMVMRVLLLLGITWVMGLTQTLFTAMGNEISGRDLILIVGGMFLIGKATFEIHDKLEGAEEHGGGPRVPAAFRKVIVQIVLLDIVFSLDSVITAVGMAQHVGIMIVAVIVAVGIMLAFAGKIGEFIKRHPTMKMLALSFLLLIGVTLVADGLGQHIPKGYIYFSMAFSLFVEVLNLRLRKKTHPVKLHHAGPR